jgi:hypothetical protein
MVPKKDQVGGDRSLYRPLKINESYGLQRDIRFGDDIRIKQKKP